MGRTPAKEAPFILPEGLLRGLLVSGSPTVWNFTETQKGELVE